MDWQRYWEEFPARFGEEEFCRQVGRTSHGGRPTPEAELDVAIEQARRGLRLGAGDRLLDLCCGNGLLTRRLAHGIEHATGVDFSQTMIALARRHQQAAHVRFERGSVLELPELLAVREQPFTKACLLESLHYFETSGLSSILTGLLAVTERGAIFYFSGVLDAGRQDRFYDTEERRREHERRIAEGTDVMGHWWTRQEVRSVADALGCQCEFLPQDARLNTAHYRFDVRITRAEG